MSANLPKELVNLILEYSGKIKYRNCKYIDQINIDDNKYKSVIQNLKDKINTLNKITVQYNGSYCLNTLISQNKYGIVHWHDFNIHMFAFYKIIDNKHYSFADVYYKFLGFYVNDLPISTYERK